MKSLLAALRTCTTAATLTAALLSPAFAQDTAAAGGPAKPDLAKGGALSAQTCGACHTNDGSRGVPTYPILQGQHAEYLVKQLAEFKAGKRDNPIMRGMAAPLTEDDMRNVAAFYESKQPKPGAAKHKDTVEMGQKIWRGGIGDRAVPACAGCHGPTGMGVPAQYPRLSGQHSDYIEAQLVAFRAGKRNNSPQMTAIAAKMNDAEIKAVSDYATGLH